MLGELVLTEPECWPSPEGQLCAEAARFTPAVRGPPHTLCQAELLAGGFSSELQVLSKGHFSGNCCQFSPILVSSTRFVPQSEACAEQTEA